MNLSKHREFFNPDEFKDEIHVIGCGAIGSTIAENLTRLGINQLHLYDFDTVSEHNITNQMFYAAHIGLPKLQAIYEICKAINQNIEIILHPEGWKKGTRLAGHVFVAVDNIETRKEIIDDNFFNCNIKAFYDTRMRLIDAQHFAAEWCTKNIKFLKSTMDFSREEAAAATPLSACGTALNVTPTVRIICGFVVSNFLNYVLHQKLCKTVIINIEQMIVDAFDDDGPRN